MDVLGFFEDGSKTSEPWTSGDPLTSLPELLQRARGETSLLTSCLLYGVINCGRGPDILRFVLEFSGVLVLGEDAALDLRQPGVIARSGLRVRLPSDLLDNARVYLVHSAKLL